jgi:hypothetical protein
MTQQINNAAKSLMTLVRFMLDMLTKGEPPDAGSIEYLRAEMDSLEDQIDRAQASDTAKQ